MTIRDLINDKYGLFEKRLNELSKRDLVHLLKWGFDKESQIAAIDNPRCVECKSIKQKLLSL